jgi:glycosyltransferase involved in cell wall biosynthesis
MPNNRIALFLPSLEGGGAERVMVNLAEGFAAEGRQVDLVLVKAKGAYLSKVPEQVRIIDLKCSRVVTSLFRLAGYLRKEKPAVLLSAMDHANVIAILAKRFAGVSTRIAVSVHSTLSVEVEKAKSWRGKIMPWFINKTYPKAETVIAVSTGVAEDLSETTRLHLSTIKVIYNPVVTPELEKKKYQAPGHSWFKENHAPVLLAVGRLSEQKDFTNLIQAFAIIRQQRECRLLILGEGEQRKQLETLVDSLGLQNDVQMPGFVENPYAFMSKADVFVLSSAWEGLVTVMIEALACGTPVVSTDCPSGSSEILEAGKYGRLVPVGDSQALAAAVIATLDEEADAERLIARANDFTQDASVKQYLAVLDGEEK